MTARGTLALVAVAVALGAWVALVELRPSPPPAPVALLAAPARVARVEIVDPDGTLVAIRDDGGWVDAAGRRWPAHAVDGFLDALGGITAIRELTPPDDQREPYGFAGRRLRLLGADGLPSLDLELGDQNPALTGVYVRPADRPKVLLVGGLLVWELKKLHDAAPRAKP